MDGICSIWVGHLDWSLGPGPRIYSPARAQHAGTGPLDVGLRRFESKAMGIVGKSDRQCRLLVQATNLHCCHLSLPAAKQRIHDTSSARRCDSHPSPVSSHRIALHRMASHHTSRAGRGVRASSTGDGDGDGGSGRERSYPANGSSGPHSARVIQRSSNHQSPGPQHLHRVRQARPHHTT